jgi:hypothetical protein
MLQPTLQRTRHLSGCNGGPCPHVHETTIPGIWAIQGERPEMSTRTGWITVPGLEPTAAELAAMATVAQIPGHENVVLVLQETLDGYARTGRVREAHDFETTVLVPAHILDQALGALV